MSNLIEIVKYRDSLFNYYDNLYKSWYTDLYTFVNSGSAQSKQKLTEILVIYSDQLSDLRFILSEMF